MGIIHNPFRTCSNYWNEKTIEAPQSSNYTSLSDENDDADDPVERRRRESYKVILVFLSGILAFGLLVTLVKIDHNYANYKKMLLAEAELLEEEDEMIYSSEKIRLVTTAEEARGVAEGVSPKSLSPVLLGAINTTTPSFSWTKKMLDWQRTAFHFQPKHNWMNGN